MAVNIKSRKLNDRELEVFQAFKQFARTQPETPSQSEIAKFLKCSIGTVNKAIKGLVAKGYLDVDVPKESNCSPRSYQIANFQRFRNAKTA
jgi:DNA replication protein DnaD